MGRQPDRRTVLRRIQKARKAVNAEMAAQSTESKYAAAMANEGYCGGYRDALDDVEAALTYGYVSRRGWWG